MYLNGTHRPYLAQEYRNNSRPSSKVNHGSIDWQFLLNNMATFVCRVQYLDDTDPFSSTNFPEPTRPPFYTFHINVPLINQIGGVHKLLGAPQKVSEILILQTSYGHCQS